MKAENLAKLMLANCLTKKGEILSSDFDMLYHLIYFPKAKKEHLLGIEMEECVVQKIHIIVI